MPRLILPLALAILAGCAKPEPPRPQPPTYCANAARIPFTTEWEREVTPPDLRKRIEAHNRKLSRLCGKGSKK